MRDARPQERVPAVSQELVRGADLSLWEDGVRAADSVRDEDAVPLSLRTTAARVRASADAAFLPQRYCYLPAVCPFGHETVRLRQEDGSECALLAGDGEGFVWNRMREVSFLLLFRDNGWTNY